MSNVVVPNFSPRSVSTQLDLFSIIWKLTRAMKAAGWVYKASGNGTTKETTGVATSDLWGGNANPLLDSYPAFGTATAWWCAQGPSTLKIPITSGQTPGTYTGFIKGEVVTQATTGAKGELIGYLYDSTAVQGFLVVLPRVDGAGADPHGWDHTNVITGGLSGATVTPSATVIEFVREVVFWKDATLLNLTHYVQCVDQSAESTSRFSHLASTAAGCTASVAPGGGGTSNTFPTVGSYTAGGTGGSLSASPIGLNSSAATNTTRAQIIAANAIYDANTSADGSFIFVIGSPNAQPMWHYNAMQGYIRVNNHEDGDVDPYVSWVPSNDLQYVPAVSAKLTNRNSGVDLSPMTGNTWSTSGLNFCRMWRRRGFSSSDAFTNGQPACLFAFSGGIVIGGNFSPVTTATHDRDRLANAFSDVYIGEDIWIISTNTSNKMRKGTLRWIKLFGGNMGDTYGYNGSKSWLAVSGAVPGVGVIAFAPGYLIGPWDGSTDTVSTY